MHHVFVQRNIMNLALGTRVVGWLCLVLFGSLFFFMQPTITEAVNLGTFTAVATSSAAGNNDGWLGVAYGNGRFVAVGTGTDRVMYSDDGLDWTAVSALGDDDSWTDVTFGNGIFVAVGTGPDRVMISANGIDDWTIVSASDDNDAWQGITYAEPYFIAVGTGPDRLMRSSDGTNWSAEPVLGDDDSWIEVTNGNGVYVAIADDASSTDYIMYSTDSFNWQATTLPGNMNDMVSVSYGNNRFIIVTQSGAVYQSFDGILWSLAATFTGNTIDQSIFANGLFLVFGTYASTSSIVFTSPDGLTWTSTLIGISSTTKITDITYGEGRFVAVSNAGNRIITAASALWSLTQTGFQFRNDNGSEIAATSIRGQNSTLEFPAQVPVRLRTQIDSQLGTTTTPYYLQYKNTGTENDWHTIGLDDPFPWVRSQWASFRGADSTTHDLQQPQCLSGDLNLVIFSHDGAQTSQTISTGWRKLGEASNGVVVTGAIYYKFADGDDNLIVTTTAAEDSSFISYCIAGAGAPTATVADGSGANSDAPLHVTDAVRNHLFFATRSGDDTTVASAGPTGFSSVFSRAALFSTGASTDVSYQYSRASSSNPGAFTSGAQEWVSWTIAVPPRQTPTVGTLEAAINKTPATSTNNSGYGSIAWTNPGRATTSDQSRATMTVSSTTASNYLNVTQWGFAIPSNATITGITASVEKSQSGGSSGFVRDNSIRLIKAGTVVGNNYASTTQDWQTTEYVSTYGTSSNLWGSTFTPADINASNFGIAIAAAGSAVGANRVANIDHVNLNVYYTVPAPFRLTTSANIATNGASTTARMIAPTIHTKTDFRGGHITEDQTPTPAVTIAESSYTELEWSLIATGTATTGETYQFRTSTGLDAPIESIAGNALFTIAPTTTTAFFTLNGIAYTDIGSTTVAAGQEIVVALGETNPVLYSTTTTSGGAFTIRVATSSGSGYVAVTTEKSSDTIVSVAYGKGRHVALTQGTDVLTSKDGIRWKKRPTYTSNVEWTDIAYGEGVFVAVGKVSSESSDSVMFSNDGVYWQTANPTYSLAQSWTSVTYGRGRFVAVADENARSMYSDDGINWTSRDSGVAGDDDAWSSVTYGNRRFTAVSTAGNNRVMTSSDGINWTARSAAGDNDSWTSITFGKGRYVAIGNSGGDRAMYSNDGINWTAQSALGNDDGWKGIKYGNGRYIAIGRTGNNRAMSSVDGIIWSALASALNSKVFNGISFGNGKFTVVGSPSEGSSVTNLESGIGPDTAIVVYSKSTTSPSTTFVSGLDGLTTLSGVPLYGKTMLVYNATTSSTTSITKLDDLAFYDSVNDSSILYSASSTGENTILTDLITATGTTQAPGYLTVAGDFTQNGQFDSDDGRISFTGTDAIVSGAFTDDNSLGTVAIPFAPGGKHWVTQTDPGGDNDWNAVTYGNGRFVAVAAYQGGDRVMYSDDGLYWSTTTAPGTRWLDVTYGEGLFVAVGTLGYRVMTSPDGITWTEHTAAGDDDAWASVTYGNGRFVAVGYGDSDEVMYSDDGINWVATTAAGDNDDWTSVTYGNGLFVAVSEYSDTPVITSPDGITWTARSVLGNDDNWSEVAYGGGLFVAVSSENNGGDTLMTSPDGITWTARTNPISQSGMSGLTYGNGQFVAVGNNPFVISSPDGIAWTVISASDNNEPWSDVTYGKGLFVAVGQSIFGDQVMTTNNKVTFVSPVTLKNLSVDQNTIAAMASTTIITGDLTNAGRIENSGTTTFSGTAGILTMQSSYKANAQFDTVVITGSTTILGSATTSRLTIDPAATLIVDLANITVEGDLTQNGTIGLESSKVILAGKAPVVRGNFTEANAFGDLEIAKLVDPWTVQTPAGGGNDEWTSVAYGNGLFVAVSTYSDDKVMTSPDGVTWTVRSAPGTSWSDIVFGNGQFVVVGDNGTRVMTSPDGITWTGQSAAGNDDSWTSITYGEGLYVAVGAGGDYVMTSPDGVTWTVRTAAGGNNNWSAVVYGNGRFVAGAGYDGADRIMYSDDGISWTTASAADDDDWWAGMAYGNGLFVAVASYNNSSKIITSSDGVTWAIQTIPGNVGDLQDIAYGNGQFVAVSNGYDRVITSPDGVTWSSVAAAGNNEDWRGVTYGNGRFVAVGINFGRDQVMTYTESDFVATLSTSTDVANNLTIATSTTLLAPTSTLTIGGNFENRGTFYPRAGTTTLAGFDKTISGNLTLWSDTTGPDFGRTNITGTYTYIGNGTTSALTIETDGTLTAPNGGSLTVVHDFTNNGTYVHNGATTTVGGNLAGNGTGSSTLGNVVVQSRSQGQEWQVLATSSALGNNDNWGSITYSNGRFVAVGGNIDGSPDTFAAYSTDGTTWIASAPSFTNNNWSSVAYGNDTYVAVSLYGGGPIMTSPDGISWTGQSPSGIASNWSDVTFGNGLFVAIGAYFSDNRVMYSSDGITWATTTAAGNNDDWISVTYGNGLFVAVGDDTVGDGVMYSSDGITWATTTVAGGAGIYTGVAYGNGRFVAVTGYDEGGPVIHSQDGVNWVKVSDAPDYNWNHVTYGNGYFVAVSSDGRIMKSEDGVTWTLLEDDFNGYLSSVAYGNGRFVAVSCGADNVCGVTGDRIVTSLNTSMLADNASTSNLTITASSTLNASGTSVSVAGNYSNQGTLIASSSTFIFDGISAQVATGTMSGSSTFNNLTIVNTSGNGTTTSGVSFGAPVSATGTMTMFASTSASFLASSTNTFNTVNMAGSIESPVWLRSSIPGTQWNLDIDGTQKIAYVDVRDSNATTTIGGVLNSNGTDSGNNINWEFTMPAQIWNDTDWVLYDTLTIQQENIDSDLTNFPVYVNLNDLSSTFWSTTPTGSTTVGTDIRVTTEDNIEVPRELVFASSTLETGELYFKAPAISSTTDTVFKIWYNGSTEGDYGRSATYGSENVWTNDFVLVAHLQEDPSGGVGAIKDSTRFNHNGTGGGAMTAADSVTGKTGRGLDFDGTLSDVVSFATSSRLANLSPLSVCTWYQHDTYTEQYAQLVDKSLDGQTSWNLYIDSADDIGFLYRQGGYLQAGSVNGNWQYICATDAAVGGANGLKIYNNGTDAGGSIAGFGIGSDDTNVPLKIGSGAAAFSLDGRMDEVRIASTTRSAAWIAAEYYNQSTTTDFYSIESDATSVITLGNHGLGQINNTFDSVNKTDETLFTFSLIPSDDSASTTVTLDLANALGIDSNNLSDWRLYRDNNANQIIDGGDVQLGGAGTFSTTSVIFATPFLVTASHSYLVTADITNVEVGDRLTISLNNSRINATSTISGLSLPVVGSASSVNHLRSRKGGGGGSVNFINIGAPGNGIETGGGNTGGEELGGQPNFNPPTTTGTPHNEWASGASGYLSDGSYATESTAGERQSYSTYGFNIPTNNQINGIEIKLEASASTPAGTIEVALSWDNGTSITTTRTTATLSTTDTIYTLGSPSDLWGRAWVPAEFANGSFGVRIIGQPSGGNTVRVDAMQVRVYNQAGGGGSGGGSGEL